MPRTKKCWICGDDVTQTAVDKTEEETFYLKVSLVTVNRPYNKNWTWKPVYVCHKCSKEKLGLTHDGRNINTDRGQDADDTR